VKAFIAFGSNLGDRLAALSEARRRLAQTQGVTIVAASPVYESEAVGCEPSAQPFLNAVVEVETELDAHALLRLLGGIEQSMGREAKRKKNAPRRIDLDLLLAGGLILRDESLTLPHPRLTERRFVLQPLAEIESETVVPGTGKTVRVLLKKLTDTHWLRLMAATW
jgi:2-amino-4-hydroxy-6-hydroxymethyldihydropteridine diphosphokinase